MAICSAFQCKSRSERKEPGITFHRFPVDRKRRNLWIQGMRLAEWSPTRNDRICSKHFEERFFYQSGEKRRLLYGAVPTIFSEFPKYMEKKEGQNDDSFKCVKRTSCSAPYTSRNLTSSEMWKWYRECKRLREAQAAQVKKEGQGCESSALRKLKNSEKCKLYRERRRLRDAQAARVKKEGQGCESSALRKLKNSEKCKRYRERKRLRKAQAAQAQNLGQDCKPSTSRKLTNSEMCKRYRERGKRLKDAQAAQAQNKEQDCESSTPRKLTNSEMCKRYRQRKRLREAQAAQAQNERQDCEPSTSRKLTNSEMCKRYRERKRLKEGQAAQVSAQREINIVPSHMLNNPILSVPKLKMEPKEEISFETIPWCDDEKVADLYIKSNEEERTKDDELIEFPHIGKIEYKKEALDQEELDLYLDEPSYIKWETIPFIQMPDESNGRNIDEKFNDNIVMKPYDIKKETSDVNEVAVEELNYIHENSFNSEIIKFEEVHFKDETDVEDIPY